MFQNKKIIENAFSKEELENFEKGGGVFWNPDGVFKQVLVRPLIDHLEDKIDFSEVKVILDIGSRDACQSLELNRFFPNAKILAFEPVPSSYEYCLKNTSNINEVEVYPYAVSDFNGKTEFYEVFNGNVGASSLLRSLNPNWMQRKIEVECINIENFLKTKNIEKVDIIWADVQGAEELVFNSLGSFLPKTKAIATEIGLTNLYENGSSEYDLSKILIDFELVDSQKTPDMTEADQIYLNKSIL
tara:strand:+ start:520 stop:1251 length:732 start_codon:yes stop_codon:yes gene_type:complete